MALLELRDSDAIDLGTATDFHTLLRAVDEALPHDATLLLEGGSIAAPVAAFLEAHAAPEPRALVPLGTPPAPAFHLPLGALRELRTIAEDHLRFEIATHLAVYREDVLLWAPRAGDGVISLSLALPDETIEAFRSALGTSLMQPSRRRWLFSRARDD